MIQANELRIGNRVFSRNENQERVDSIRNDEGGAWIVNFKGTKRGDYCGDLKPIPLTPELLEKCGFELKTKNSYWCYQDKAGFYISMWSEDRPCAGFEKKGCFYYGDNYLPVEYLHDFQNLYFAHTRQELTIKHDPSTI